MKKNDVLLIVSVALYSYLFYSQTAGINFLIFNLSLISCLIIRDKNVLRNPSWIVSAIGSIISSIFIYIYGNSLSITANILSLAMLSAFSIHKGSSAVFGILYSVYSVASSYVFMILDSIERRGKNKLKKGNKTIIKILSGAAIFIVVLIFFILYRASNPLFYNLTKNINLDFITWGWVGFTTLGVFIMYGFFYNKNIPAFYRADSNKDDSLKAKDFQSKISRVNIENIAGSILLILLNILLITVNILDTVYLWGNGKLPAGMSYSDFVHQGTETLILSVIIAISIILFFFRSHLNFFEKNKILKAMAYLWILQNLFMIISTAYRNELYIAEYTLTYKRIGVIIYLLLCAIGLSVTFIKILKLKNNWFLIRKNSWAFYAVMICSCFINWDSMITNYNITHAKNLDRYYLLNFSYINIPQLSKLQPIDETKQKMISEENEERRRKEYFINYTNTEFQYLLNSKIYDFMKNTQNSDWQSYCYSKNFVKSEIENLIKDNYFKEFDLHYKFINTLLPIRSFSCIEKINLTNNQIKDLGELRFFPKLEKIDISYNTLNNINSMPALTNLKELVATNNQIRNFASLRNFQKLELLNFSNNNISNLSSLPTLSNLNSLMLTNNPIHDLYSLSKMNNLKYLNLSQTNSKCLESLPTLNNLSQLDMSLNNISDKDTVVFEKLKNQKNLEELNIANNNLMSLYLFSDFFVDAKSKKIIRNSLPLLKNIKILNISNNRLYNINELENYTQLQTLNISLNEIKNFIAISKLTSLESLDISSNHIRDISFIKGLYKLKVLQLSSNEIMDIDVLKSLKSLTTLQLNNNRITDISMLCNLNFLKELYLCNNSITNLNGLEKLSNLEILSIHNNQIKDYSPLFKMKHLKELTLSDISKTELAKLKLELKNTKISVMNYDRNESVQQMKF